MRLPQLGTGERPWDPSSRIGLAFVCAVLVIALGLKYPSFLSSSNIFITLLSVTSIGIAGIGTTALLLSGNVDLSIGGQYAFIGMLTGIVARDTQSTPAAIGTAIAAGIAIGYFNGRLVRALRINPLIVTLGMAAVLHGFAFVLSGGVSVFEFSEGFVNIGRHYFGPVPLPVVVGLIVFAIASILLLHTVAGLRIYAIGGSPSAANLSGIDVDRYVTSLFVINGALIGLVAVMSVSRLGSASPSVGVGFELEVLTAVILGGVAFTGGAGHPLGVLIGVITIGVMNAGVVFAGIADYWQQIVLGSALLIALSADQFASQRRSRRRIAAEILELDSQDGHEPGSRGIESGSVRRPPVGSTAALACHGLSKSYGSVRAAVDVSFSVSAGEIMCLVGDNGAGKSTVIKILSGATKPDEGRIELGGVRVEIDDPAGAHALGIATAYQELALCPNLGVAENLTLGAEPRRAGWGVLSWRDDRAAEQLSRERLSELHVTLGDLKRPVRLLSGGQRQSVAIARVAQRGASLVILDEPTAALGLRQTQSVLELVRSLADAGVAMIVITHDVQTVLDLAHRIVVLRLGRVVFDGPAEAVDQSELIHLMAGLQSSAVRGGQL